MTRNQRLLSLGLVFLSAAACSQERTIRVVGPISNIGVALEHTIFFQLQSCGSIDGIFCEDGEALPPSGMTVELIEGSIDFVEPLAATELNSLIGTIVATAPGPVRFLVTTAELGPIEFASEARDVRSSFLVLTSGRTDRVDFLRAHTEATKAKVFGGSRVSVNQFYFDTELASPLDALSGQFLQGRAPINQVSGESAFTLIGEGFFLQLETERALGEGRIETALGGGYLDIDVVDISDVATIRLREFLKTGEQDALRIERGKSGFVEIIALDENDIVIEGDGALFDYEVFQSNLILTVTRREFGVGLHLGTDEPGTTELTVSLGGASASVTVIVE